MTEACRLPCFGGFAVTLAYGLSRLTFDIDVLLILSELPTRPTTMNPGYVPCMKEHFSICIC